MTSMIRRRVADVLAVAAIASGVMALVACSTTTPEAETITVTSTVTVAPTATRAADACATNPSEAAVPTVGPYETVPDVGRISVTLNGIPSGTVTPGAAPTEVGVTVCNDSAVAYPAVGVVFVLANCSCVPGGSPIAKGTVERFDDASGAWVQQAHPAAGTGMDYLGGYSTVQELPKGKQVSLRYRITLDPSMTAGEGGVLASVVTVDPLNQIGSADLRFRVTD
jgi:hypothetical protein